MKPTIAKVFSMTIILMTISLILACAPAGWQRQEMPDASVSMIMPGVAQTAQQNLNLDGFDVAQTSFFSQDKGIGYMIVKYQYPDKALDSSKAESILENAIQGLIKDSNGTLIDSKAITVLGFVGKEYSFISSEDSVIYRMRTFIKENAIYDFGIYCLKSRETSMEANYFLDSIQLK